MSAVEVMTANGERLAELACEINADHDDVQGLWWTACEAAIALGKKLILARSLVERGQWVAWLSDNVVFSHTTAASYMRAAVHEDAVLRSGAKNLGDMARFLKVSGLTRLHENGTSRLDDATLKARAAQVRALLAEGYSLTAAAAELGVARSTVDHWLYPAKWRQYQRTKQKRLKDGRKALVRAREDKLAKERGDAIGELYSLVRKTLSPLIEQAVAQEANEEARKRLAGEATWALHRLEDAIVAALGTSERRRAAISSTRSATPRR